MAKNDEQCRHKALSCEECISDNLKLAYSIGRELGLEWSIKLLGSHAAHLFLSRKDTEAINLRGYVIQLEAELKNVKDESYKLRKEQGIIK